MQRRTRWMTAMALGSMLALPALGQDVPAVPGVPPPADGATKATPATAPAHEPVAVPAPAPAVPAVPSVPKVPAVPATPPSAAPKPAAPEATEPQAEVPAPAKPQAAEPDAVKPPVAASGPAPAEAAPATQVATTQPASTQPSTRASAATTGPATTRAATQPATEPALAADTTENTALAERMITMAVGLVRSQENQPQANMPATWRYAVALIESATRLAPNEPRYAQFLVEACNRAGDADAALKALAAYRKIRPDDEFAQVQQIDKYLSRMERLEKKIEYLKAIVAAETTIGPAVRSVAACRAAQVYAERMENAEAWKMVNTAFELNPLSLEALKMKYEQLRMGRPEDRLAGLLRMLLSNPAQPAVGVGIARELANIGNVKRAIEWYNLSLDMHRRMGMTPPNDVGVDYAAEIFINGDAKNAALIASQLTQTNPDDLNAWLLRLILAKNLGDKPALETVIRQASIALGNRIATIRKSAGDATATTRPVESPDPFVFSDAMEDAKRIAATGQKDLVSQFVAAAGGVAFLKIYFEDKPAQALPWIKAVTSLAGESDEVAQRLMGWSYLKVGNKEDAKAKLSAVADKDAVAALGMIQLNDDGTPAARQAALEAGKKLMAQSPAGLQGALLYDALSSRGVKVEPGASVAIAEKLFGEFPKDWMKIVDQPQLFYTLRLEPIAGGVGVAVGDPLLVLVTLSNTGSYPLTIGSDGVIHPDLWIDAQLRGAARQVFPAEAYARIAGPLVLLPKGQPITQVVRLDQGALAAQLNSYPTAPFQISAAVMTNPSFSGGQVGLGPAGISSRLNKLMERKGAPPGQPSVRDKLFAAAENGTPAEKVRAVETLTKFATLPGGDPNNEGWRQLVGQSTDAVHRGTADPDPSVRAWSAYLSAMLPGGDKSTLNALVTDPSWVGRALGVIATDYLGENHDIYRSLADSDPDPLVKKLAAAALEANIKRPATSQPSTQPDATPNATQPAAAPVAAAPVTPGAPAAPDAATPAAAPAGSTPVPGAPGAPAAPVAPLAGLSPGTTSGPAIPVAPAASQPAPPPVDIITGPPQLTAPPAASQPAK